MERNTPKPVTGGLDVTVPVSARIWSYWGGGKDYFAVDKAAGDEFAALYPGIRPMARASRLFLGRAVTYLAGELSSATNGAALRVDGGVVKAIL